MKNFHYMFIFFITIVSSSVHAMKRNKNSFVRLPAAAKMLAKKTAKGEKVIFLSNILEEFLQFESNNTPCINIDTLVENIENVGDEILEIFNDYLHVDLIFVYINNYQFNQLFCYLKKNGFTFEK